MGGSVVSSQFSVLSRQPFRLRRIRHRSSVLSPQSSATNRHSPFLIRHSAPAANIPPSCLRASVASCLSSSAAWSASRGKRERGPGAHGVADNQESHFHPPENMGLLRPFGLQAARGGCDGCHWWLAHQCSSAISSTGGQATSGTITTGRRAVGRYVPSLALRALIGRLLALRVRIEASLALRALMLGRRAAGRATDSVACLAAQRASMMRNWS